VTQLQYRHQETRLYSNQALLLLLSGNNLYYHEHPTNVYVEYMQLVIYQDAIESFLVVSSHGFNEVT